MLPKVVLIFDVSNVISCQLNDLCSPLLLQTVDGKVHFVYKRVAVVEQFFDIIYSVHVESAGDTQLRGRAGKHCGQKRTYRAVSEFITTMRREKDQFVKIINS